MGIQVCRICLKRYNNVFTSFYKADLEGNKLSVIINELVPELYLGVSKDPVICCKCHKQLGIAYNFRLICLRSENLIGQYIRATKNASNSIDLEDVVDYWMTEKESRLSGSQDDDKTQDEHSVEATEKPTNRTDEKSNSPEPQTPLFELLDWPSELEGTDNLILDAPRRGQLDLTLPTRTYTKKLKTSTELHDAININKVPAVKVVPKKKNVNLIPSDPNDKDLTDLIDELKKNNNLSKLGISSKETNENQSYIIKKVVDKSTNSVSFALIPTTPTESKKADSVASSDEDCSDPFDWYKGSNCPESSDKPDSSAPNRNDSEEIINVELFDEKDDEESQNLSEKSNKSIGNKQNDTIASEKFAASSSSSDTPVQINRPPGIIKLSPKPKVPIQPDKPPSDTETNKISDRPRPIIRVRPVSSLQKVRTLNHELWPQLPGCSREPSFELPKSYPATTQKPEREPSQQPVSYNLKSVSLDPNVPQKNIRIITLNSKNRATTNPHTILPKISRIRRCYTKMKVKNPSSAPHSLLTNQAYVLVNTPGEAAPKEAYPVGPSESPAKEVADISTDGNSSIDIKDEPIDYDSTDACIDDIDKDNAIKIEDESLDCDSDVAMRNAAAADVIDIKDEPMDHSDVDTLIGGPDLGDNNSQVSSTGTTDSTRSAPETESMERLDDDRERVDSIVDNIPEVGFKTMAKSEDEDISSGSEYSLSESSLEEDIRKRNRKKRRKCYKKSNKQVTLNNTELQGNILPMSPPNTGTASDYFVIELNNLSHNDTVISEEKVYKIENMYDENGVDLHNTEFQDYDSLKSEQNKSISKAESHQMSESNIQVSLNHKECQENISPVRTLKTCTTSPTNSDDFVIESNSLSHNDTASLEEEVYEIEHNYNENEVDLDITESQNDDSLKSEENMSTSTALSCTDNPMTTTNDSLNSRRKHSPYNEIVISAACKKNGKRIRNKGHICYFCNKHVIHMSRHLEAVHPKETEVAKFLIHPKFSEQRRKAIAEIIRVGDFYHNCNVLATKRGELILVRRPSMGEAKFAKVNDYGPCPNCLGFVLKKHLWHHLKYACKENVDETQARLVIAESNSLISDICEVGFTKEYIQNITSKFNSDDIGDICKNDDLILKLGAMQFEKYGDSKSDLIRQTMRQLARLTVELNKLDNSSKSLADFIIPSKFDLFIQATKAVCESITNSSRPEFKTPSLALKIGYSLKRCVGILRGAAIRARNMDLNESLTLFQSLMDMEWSVRISSEALETYRRKNAIELLPLTKDLVKLVNYLDSCISIAIKAIEGGNRTYQSYARLASLVLARIILLNKRRSGEAAKMKISEYIGRSSLEQQNTEEMKNSFTPLEQKLAETLSVVQIEEKGGRKTPVLITALIKDAIDILVKHRETCDISENNIYVFAKSNPSSFSVRGYECLKQICGEIDLGKPEIITGTRMEKYVATVCQLLDMAENQYDWLACHLGHDITVRKDFYRTRESEIELAKVSRLLLAVDKGEANQFSGKHLDEIEIKDLPFWDDEEENKEESDDLKEKESEEEIGREIKVEGTSEEKANTQYNLSKTKPVSTKKIGKARAKRTVEMWTKEQRDAVRGFFKQNINNSVVPGKGPCTECINKHKVLSSRSWKNIKYFVKNEIYKIRRK